MTWCWARTTQAWTRAVACLADLLASPSSFAQVDSGSPTSFSLLYEADAGCPERTSLVRQFREHAPLVGLTDQPSARVIRITAHASEGLAWGEVRVEQAGGAAVPRRVEAGDCAAAVKALVLIAVVTVDPSGPQRSPLEATAASDTAPDSRTASGSGAASDTGAVRESGTPSATGGERNEAPRGPEPPPDPEPRLRSTRAAAGAPPPPSQTYPPSTRRGSRPSPERAPAPRRGARARGPSQSLAGPLLGPQKPQIP